MKKSVSFIVVNTLMFAYFLLCTANANRIVKPGPMQEGGTGTMQISSGMLNGKPSFYKTYDDFANGTGKNWTFFTLDASMTFNNQISKVNIIFKDEAGKRLKITPEEFWGWRSANGELYRNGDFVSGKITKYPFMIDYATKDYILYHPATIPTFNVSVTPSDWFSADMKSSVLSGAIYFKTHDKATFMRIGKLENDTKKAMRPLYTGKEWKEALKEAYHNSSDIICFWLSTGFNKGNYTK